MTYLTAQSRTRLKWLSSSTWHVLLYKFHVYKLMTSSTSILWKKLVNTSIALHNYHLCVCVCVCWEYLKSTLSATFTYKHSIVNYGHHAVHYNFPKHAHLLAGSLCTLPALSLWRPKSCLCFCEFGFFRFHILGLGLGVPLWWGWRNHFCVFVSTSVLCQALHYRAHSRPL